MECAGYQIRGYSDQSQLINNFRHYTGITATHYLKLQQQICNLRDEFTDTTCCASANYTKGK
ncbi:hypothetical protein C7T94_04010 [Pedobacter yulinensis]|uniref:Uncharacterized protein n=1 Tax=Pedobacter yulinensis TaxID=2126353 RepID=A0A2T3HND2_9SPHI|nr:AraC family transcriptional regulator [Pedobacter yulinensis]PST83917.1 hypothetical protein C7T94_04010 [Pedobacter yulinensis]